MRKKRWHFKNNYEDFTVLYEDDTYILVKNDNSKKYSFGMTRDFGTLYGFPVNWSCLLKEELIELLNKLIIHDTEYILSAGEFAEKNVQRWKQMISSIDYKNRNCLLCNNHECKDTFDEEDVIYCSESNEYIGYYDEADKTVCADFTE